MFVFLLGAASPDAVGSATIAQQAGAIQTSLCGGHGQPPLACHAPNNCCRPDQALLPPRTPAPEPAFARAVAVAYAPFHDAPAAIADIPAFRSRAPPV
jgi:hypothetical protein